MTAITNTKQNFPLEIFRGILDHPDYSHIDSDYFERNFYSYESPLKIPDMEKAVLFLHEALSKQLSIVVVGDKDVDGVASTAMLVSFLRKNHESRGGKLQYRVSDEGDDYGISSGVLKDITSEHADLYIFLDMGSSHSKQIQELIQGGAKAIVLDHHQIPDAGPVFERCAFVNPVRISAVSPYATVTLVFKFLSAYGFYHTSEWNTASLIETDGSSMPLYRCGLYLGSFSDSESAQKKADEFSLEFKTITRENSRSFIEDRIMDKIQNEPEAGGNYYLAARVRSLPRMSKFLYELTDLVSVGNITDMMPLVKENRMLVRIGCGYDFIHSDNSADKGTFRTGYLSLLKINRINTTRISSRDLGWTVGPALNAAGRMGRTRMALDLLLEDGEEKSLRLAKNLIQLNDERKDRTKKNEDIIRNLLEKESWRLEKPILFCYHKDLEPGVSGIVATRLTEKYKKPVVYINPDGEHARGSARSYGGVNVLEFLTSSEEHFIQFGGHPAACGFSVTYENISELEKSLLAYSENLPTIAQEEKKEPHVFLPPSRLTWDAFEEIESLEPFGPGNPEVRIGISNIQLAEVRYMSDQKHAVFGIQGAPGYLECIYWGGGETVKRIFEKNIPVNLTGSLEKSFFRGRVSLRFRVDSLSED